MTVMPEVNEVSQGDDARPGRNARARRPRWLLVVAGLACLAIGTGAWQTASALPAASARPIGGNRPISGDATDLRNIDSNNSPSLVRNPARPNNLAVANRVDTPRFSCALHYSLDGGATWDKTAIPFPEGEELPPRCYAPDVAFDVDGTLYVSFVTLVGLGNTPNAGWLTTSEDGGNTLSSPSRIEPLGPLAFQIRLTADPIRANRLYLSWVQAAEVALLQFPNDDNPILFSRSEDGGLTWQRPVQVSPEERKRVVAPSLAVGPEGRLYLLYLDLEDDLLDYRGAHEGRGGDPYPGTWSLALARSGDGGRTWQTTDVDNGIVPTERILVFLPPVPSLAVDRSSGSVYAAFHDGRLGDADVWLWSSADAGRSFSPPRRVNDTRSGDGTSQYLPRATVAPDGRVDIVYYDRRSDSRRNIMNDVSLQYSTDGAETFSPRLRLNDKAFDSRIGFGSERDMPDLGSRLALLSTESRTMAVWTDTRAGSEASGKQDLARAVVTFSPGSPLRGPLRAGGVALAGLGAVALVWGIIPRRRRRDPALLEEEGPPAPGGPDDDVDLPAMPAVAPPVPVEESKGQ